MVSVSLDVYEGPVDLLLDLAARQKIDIHEVSLSDLTADYVAKMRASGLDLNQTTGFLVVAASLLELKASRLFPTEDEDEPGSLLEERDVLLARLVASTTYRRAGRWLGRRMEERKALHRREITGVKARNRGPLRLSLGDLAEAAGRLLKDKPKPDIELDYLPTAKASVREAVELLSLRLQEAGEATFAWLCGDAMGRGELIARFLALLELCKAGAVEADQKEAFGEIRVRWVGAPQGGELLAEVEEYEMERG